MSLKLASMTRIPDTPGVSEEVTRILNDNFRKLKDALERAIANGQLVPAAASVVSETAFGASAAVGDGTAYARADHTHGTPVDPVTAHVSAGNPHTQYQLSSAKDQASGYAGLNASSRVTKGADTADDLIVDLATKGLVLKDTQGTPHYWRVTVSTLGLLVVTDLGTTKP